MTSMYDTIEQLTFENCRDKLVHQIAKIIGISLGGMNKEYIKDALILRNKYDSFMEILNFINNSGRTSINPFLFKVKKEFDKIKSKDWYKDIDMDEIVNERKELLKLKDMTIRNYANWQNDMKYFLSIDIKSANFTVLKEISKGGDIHEESWSDYLKRVYPKDVRTERNRNILEDKNGLVTEIPDCIYESKWFRQFLLSDLNKLQVLWEIKILNLLKSIIALSLENKICVNSDEIIIMIDNYDEGDQIVKLVSPNEATFRIKKFQLTKVDGYGKNCMVKTFMDGTKVLVNCLPKDSNELYEKFIL